MDKTFKTLILIVNAVLAILNANNYKIYDSLNPEFYISGIRYCKEDDQIKFDTREEASE